MVQENQLSDVLGLQIRRVYELIKVVLGLYQVVSIIGETLVVLQEMKKRRKI